MIPRQSLQEMLMVESNRKDSLCNTVGCGRGWPFALVQMPSCSPAAAHRTEKGRTEAAGPHSVPSDGFYDVLWDFINRVPALVAARHVFKSAPRNQALSSPAGKLAPQRANQLPV